MMAIQEYAPENYGPEVTVGTSDCESIPELSVKINDLANLIDRVEGVYIQVDAVLCRIRGNVPNEGCSDNSIRKSVDTLMGEFNSNLEGLDALVNSLESSVCELREYI